jgi:hypothetical protein
MTCKGAGEEQVSEAPRKEIPFPKGDDDFEDLALALYREVWKDPNAKLHGRPARRRQSGSGRPAGRCWSGRSRRWSMSNKAGTSS